MQSKIVYAGVTNTSFTNGSENLLELAGVVVSAKQIERVTKGIGLERCAERDAAVAAYQALPLVERKVAPPEVTPPPLAVVGTDGGRLQILERATTAVASRPTTEASPVASVTGAESVAPRRVRLRRKPRRNAAAVSGVKTKSPCSWA